MFSQVPLTITQLSPIAMACSVWNSLMIKNIVLAKFMCCLDNDSFVQGGIHFHWECIKS